MTRARNPPLISSDGELPGLLYGVQLTLMGVQLGRKVIWVVLPGCDRSAGMAAR